MRNSITIYVPVPLGKKFKPPFTLWQELPVMVGDQACTGIVTHVLLERNEADNILTGVEYTFSLRLPDHPYYPTPTQS